MESVLTDLEALVILPFFITKPPPLDPILKTSLIGDPSEFVSQISKKLETAEGT
jgi:hypothetical protein